MNKDGKIEEKLALLKYKPDDSSHIKINEEACKNCKTKACAFFCPAGVYKQDEQNPEIVKAEYENCLECGACKVACKCGAIEWKYPEQGVIYKFS